MQLYFKLRNDYDSRGVSFMQTILIKAFAQYRKYLIIYLFSLILSPSIKYSIFNNRLFIKILILIHNTDQSGLYLSWKS